MSLLSGSGDYVLQFEDCSRFHAMTQYSGSESGVPILKA